MMRAADDGLDGMRLRGLIVVLWRAGLRISEALALTESDLDPKTGAVLVRSGKGESGGWSGWTTGRGNIIPTSELCRLASGIPCWRRKQDPDPQGRNNHHA